MLTTLVLQLVLPLVLIAWIILRPPRDALGFWMQAAGSLLALSALTLTGIWMFPPWWAPYLASLLLVLAVLVGWGRRRPFRAALPPALGGWVRVVFFLALGIHAAGGARQALAGRTPPGLDPVELAFPLGGGTYLVVNGGNAPNINAHRLSETGAMRGNAQAVDIVKLDENGLRARGLQPVEPAAYHVYGEAVLAPCAGEVIAAVEGIPDMPVPERDPAHPAGNHVILRCGGADIVLAHLKWGSLRVGRGDRVSVGQALAEAGNSGLTDEPHLHIHAQRPGPDAAPMSGDPLPMRFGGRYLVRNDRVTVPARGVRPQ